MRAGRASIAFQGAIGFKVRLGKVDLTVGMQRMNPLHWKREYQVAWIAFCLIGGMAGLFFAWMGAAGRNLASSGTLCVGAPGWFLSSLPHPPPHLQSPLFWVAFVRLCFSAPVVFDVRATYTVP